MIQWRIHLSSAPEKVYRMLATAEGRARFWAESAEEQNGTIGFRFVNGQRLASRILERVPHERFRLSYFGDNEVSFELRANGHGGTDLTVTETGAATRDLEENRAGWVSVLLMLKAAADFGIDLRSHDPARTWDRGYVDG